MASYTYTYTIYNKPPAGTDSAANISRDMRPRDDRHVSLNIVPRPNPRIREDIGSWLEAIKQAEHPDYPRRLRLYNLYETVELDNHLTSLIEKRIARIQGAKFKLMNEAGEPVDDLLKLFDAPWFDSFLRYAAESIYWGHSLIQFNEPGADGLFTSIELVPRRHVKPETGEWLVYDFDLSGFLYRGTPMMDWYIEVGRPRDLGLYKKAGPLALWKKNALATWSQFTEIYGIPFRSIKTPGRDMQRLSTLEQIARDSGSAGWAVLQDDETMDIMEQHNTAAHMIFDALIERCNTEMSKFILHQTMTSDDGSSLSQAKVHSDVADEVHEADKRFIRGVVNSSLFPLLLKHGYPLQGVKFEWDDAKDMQPEDRIKIDAILFQNFKVSPDYIEKTYSVAVMEKETPPQLLPPGSPDLPIDEKGKDIPQPPSKGDKKSTQPGGAAGKKTGRA